MIRAKHSKWANLVMGKYLRYILRKDFAEITYIGAPENALNLPVLLMPNHFSWWDGFIFYDYNRKCLKKNFYLMMLEEELEKRQFFSKVGAFSIRKKSKSVLESLGYTRELLQDKNNIVTIFPQGQIHSLYVNEVNFMQGISYLLKNLPNDICLLQAAVFVDYFANRKSTLHIYFREKMLRAGNVNVIEIEEEYNAFYRSCREKQAQKTC